MKKSKKDTEYTDLVKSVYRLLSIQFGYTARISDLWKMICITYGKKEFEILDLHKPGVIEFESYLIDLYISWSKGEEVDFEELRDSILKFGDFTFIEELQIKSDDFLERLWAIFLCISDPKLNL